jgi:multidrug efflux pump subunit AcrA (membrane-fusion protein)
MSERIDLRSTEGLSSGSERVDGDTTLLAPPPTRRLAPPAASSYHPHQTDSGGPNPRRPTATKRQLFGAAVVVAALVAGALATIQHFSKPAGEVDGVAQPSQTFDLSFVNGGLINDVLVRPGQQVHRGQVLATQEATVENSAVAADRAALASDQAKLAADQAESQLNTTQQQNAVSVAQEAAQKQNQAASGAVVAAQAQVNEDQQRLSNDEHNGMNDQQTEFTVCSGADNASAPTPECLGAEQRVNQDSNQAASDETALQSAQAALAQAQAVASETTSVSSAQTALAASQQASKTDPTQLSADIASVQAALAQDQAKLSRDEQALSDLNITAPSDGVVSEVNAVAGEYSQSGGVANYPARSAFGQSQSQLNLLPSAPSSGQQAAPSMLQPVIRMFATGSWTVVIQVPETKVHSLAAGKSVQVQIPSLGSQWDTAVIAFVDTIPVQVQGVPTNAGLPAQYDVTVSLKQVPAGLYPGMRARVKLSSGQ